MSLKSITVCTQTQTQAKKARMNNKRRTQERGIQVFFGTDWHIEQRESCRIESVKNKQAQANSFFFFQDKSHMEELAGTEGIETNFVFFFSKKKKAIIP